MRYAGSVSRSRRRCRVPSRGCAGSARARGGSCVWVCETERPIVLTGMHRSGTSLVARLFIEAGVDLGRELLGTGEHNRAGHFEDQAFLSFHERVLIARDPSKRVLWEPPHDLAW